MTIINALNNYVPFNIQEQYDKELILEELSKNDKIFLRESLQAHITVSAWVVNKNKDKVLMAFHKIYNSWAWLGGHADGCDDLLSVAIREAKEESGITEVTPLSEDIFSIEILPVSAHMKKGKFVPTHLHLNFTYLLEADENQQLKVKEDENSNVDWIAFDDIPTKSSEPWFVENIYSKLVEKTKNFK